MNRKLLIVSLPLLFALFAFYHFQAKADDAEEPLYVDINQDTTWHKEDNLTFHWDIFINPGATLTIEKGADIKLEKNGNGDPVSIHAAGGRLIINGTQEEPVNISSSSDHPYFLIEFSYNRWEGVPEAEPSFLRFAEISNGGYEYPPDNGGSALNNLFKFASTAYASLFDSGIPAVYFSGGRVHMENCRFYNNRYADVGADYWEDSENAKSYLEIVNSNFEKNNGSLAVNSELHCKIYDYNCTQRVLLKNNWYDDPNGPSGEILNDYANGKQVIGNLYLDGWKKSDLIADPIILIPGIGASLNPDLMIGGIFKDNWTLFSHTYDGIIEALRELGFEEGKNFFICYYDWRNKNEDSAEDYLKPLIEKAKSEFGTSKVNLAAHSMGGLVARSYIQSGNDNYDDDVENLFLIGVPNKGSSDVYPVWEGGYIPKNWDAKFILRIYLAYLTKRYPTSNDYESVHSYIPSVKQLMPIYDYIYPENNPENLKDYSAMKEINAWLKDLNDGASKLNQRTRVSVISGNNQNTVNGIPVIDVDEDPLWTDGKPDPLDPAKNDENGDGRVLLLSSQIESLFSDTLNYNHGEIVSQSEDIIAARLGGGLNIIHPAPDIPNEIGFWFASPVDVEIEDPQGRIISGGTNEIPLAKYAAESKPDGFKIVSIPNPVNGEYEIKITGNGKGEFHAGLEYLDYENGENDRSSVAEGIISENEEKKYIVKYDSANLQDPVTPIAPESGDETPPTIEIFAPQNQTQYLNDSSINVNYKISDDVSGAENILSEIYYDNQPFDKNRIDLYLEHLGKHTVKITAEDEAGNKAEKEVSFDAFATIDSAINNVSTYQKLGLIDRGEAKFLLVHLKVIEHLFKQVEKRKEKEKIIEIRKRQVNGYIDWLIYYIKNKSDKKPLGVIREPAKSLLVESLEFIKFK